MGIKKLIAIFLLIAVLLMPVAVFADVPIPDPPYGAYNYWVVVQVRNGTIYLLTSPNPITTPLNGSQMHLHGGFRVYYLTDGHWSYDKEELAGASYSINHIYASNHDIAYNDGSGFFFTLPKVSELFLTAQEADYGMIWKIILDGLIPLVGLLILGISFRKGWAFLQGQLRH